MSWTQIIASIVMGVIAFSIPIVLRALAKAPLVEDDDRD